MRARQARELAGLARGLLRWQPAAGAVVLGMAVVLRAPDQIWKEAVWSLRVMALLLALGAVFALDDAAADVVAAVPLPLSWRTGLRVAAALLWTLPGWTSALLVAGPYLSGEWVLWSTLELAALLACGLALAAFLAGRGVAEPGVLAAPGLAVCWLGLYAQPAPLALFTLREQDWLAAHLRWAVVLGLAAAALAALSRDPAFRR